MASRRPEALDYPRLVRELFPRLTGDIRWGLERTRELLAGPGNPERAYRSLHIGGTNGKGTVAAIAESVLRAAGLRTGLYTSPHLTSFRERIRIDGAPVGEVELLDAARRLWPYIERQEPSFFEATTAIAFEVFARAGIEVAVIEVGLGGRLDATNVITPDVAVVTQVAVDHVQYLGSDPAGIAAEKAGIAKGGVPFLTGETDPGMLGVLEARAREAGAPVYRLRPDVPQVLEQDVTGCRFRLDSAAWGVIDARVPFAGKHQARNAALAIRALELTPLRRRVRADDVRRGVEATRWPARLQFERIDGRAWILDVAHNPSAIERLARSIRELDIERPLTALVGVMGDKDWAAMLHAIGTAADRIVLTRPEHAPSGRAWDPQAVAQTLPAGAVDVVPSLAQAVAALRRDTAGSVLVTGSFHTVGEAMIALGIDPGWPADPAPDPGLQRSESGV